VRTRTPLGADLVIPALALAFAVYFFFSIADLAWEAKANGVIIGGALVLLVLVQLVRIGVRMARGHASFGLGPLLEPRDTMWKRVGLVAVTVAFIGSLHWLGLTLGLLLALYASLWLMGARGKALYIIPVVVAALAYLLFVALLQTEIPHGPIERMLS
jgi:hypothetical protein